MASPFDALPKALATGFKGKLWPVTLVKKAKADTTLKDSHGDATPPSYVSHAGEGFPDEYSTYFKMSSGLPMSTAKVCVLGGSLPDGVKPEKYDRVLLKGLWYELGECDTDPAGALWVCPGTVIPEPEDL